MEKAKQLKGPTSFWLTRLKISKVNRGHWTKSENSFSVRVSV